MANGKRNRWGTETIDAITGVVTENVPSNTRKNKTYIGSQFEAFCDARQYELNAETSIEQLAAILQDWAYNMKKCDGTDYKESVVKLMWNVVAKMLQEKYYTHHNIIFDPFTDIQFKAARDARDAKRRELQRIPEKRRASAVVFTPEELNIIQNFWDEETPTSLQRKFYHIAATELAWRGGEAVAALLEHFIPEIDSMGTETGRIEYNPDFNNLTKKGKPYYASSKWLVPNLSNPNLCPVRLFLLLTHHRPQNSTTSRLFLTPNPNWQKTKKSEWYKNSPVGKNEIFKWTKETAAKVGLDTKRRKITNHSNRWTAKASILEHRNHSVAVTHLARASIAEHNNHLTAIRHLENATSIPEPSNHLTAVTHLVTASIPEHSHRSMAVTHLETASIPEHGNRSMDVTHLATDSIPEHCNRSTTVTHSTGSIPEHCNRSTAILTTAGNHSMNIIDVAKAAIPECNNHSLVITHLATASTPEYSNRSMAERPLATASIPEPSNFSTHLAAPSNHSTAITHPLKPSIPAQHRVKMTGDNRRNLNLIQTYPQMDVVYLQNIIDGMCQFTCTCTSRYNNPSNVNTTTKVNATVTKQTSRLGYNNKSENYGTTNVTNAAFTSTADKISTTSKDPVSRSNIVQQAFRKSNRSLQKGEPLQVLEVIPTANLGIQVLFNDGSSYEFCNVWLRDSCQCEFCWDSDHGFRVTDSWVHDVSIQAVNTWITEEGSLGVLWPDGSDTHKSVYQVDWLQEYGKSLSENKISVTRDTSHRPPLTIWQSSNFKQNDVPHLKYKDFISTSDGLKNWLELFFKFGFVILKETPRTEEAIEDMANRVGFIRKTSFGYICDMKVGPESEIHPAYTGVPIHLHTDLTYRERSPGTISLHCIEAADPESAGDDAGGETQLVDGFQVANWMKHNHPTAYHMLTTIPVPYVYKDPTTGVTYTSYWPVIGLDPSQNINEIHFSNFARQPLRFPGNLILPFYSALKVFTDKLQNPSSQLSFYLRPGDLLTMNNRRVLHARTGYDSTKVKRHMRTCYMDLDEILCHYDAVLLNESVRQTAH